MSLLKNLQPQFIRIEVPKAKIPLKVYKFVTHKHFDIFIMVCTILNIIVLGSSYHN